MWRKRKIYSQIKIKVMTIISQLVSRVLNTIPVVSIFIKLQEFVIIATWKRKIFHFFFFLSLSYFLENFLHSVWNSDFQVWLWKQWCHYTFLILVPWIQTSLKSGCLCLVFKIFILYRRKLCILKHPLNLFYAVFLKFLCK